MKLTKEQLTEIRSEKCFADWFSIGNLLDTIDAHEQTIAELTAKLDAVRGLDTEWKRRTELGFRPTGSQCMVDLLAILDAPTKPKEARNGEE